MIDFVMPSLGADMDAGTLIEWKVAPGTAVHRGQVVALVATEKATMEIEIWQDGVIAELLVEPHTKVPVGTVLARLTTAGEPVAAPAPAAAPVAAPAPAPAAAPVVAPTPALPTRPLASPAARQLARERGIDLRAVAGSGHHGVVLLRDVQRAPVAPAIPPTAPAIPPAAPAVAPPAAEPAAAPAPRKPAPDVGSPLRRAIGAAMARSKREIPHYYLAHTVELHRAMDWLARTNAALPIGERLLPAALYIRAVALALWDVPELNGTWDDGFRPSDAVHVGFAIALRTGGVIAPAIHDADTKSLGEVMADLRDLVRRARAGSLRGSELTDPTITITSVGDRGPDTIWGVINPPQVAIVGVGGVVDRPWVDAGAVVVRPTLTLSLSADHRVTDGHRGGLFLTAVARLLQEPERL